MACNKDSVENIAILQVFNANNTNYVREIFVYMKDL